MEVLGLIVRKLRWHTKRRLKTGIRVCDSLEPRLLLTVSSEVILNLTDTESFSGYISDFTFGEDLAYFVTSTPTTGREFMEDRWNS